MKCIKKFDRDAINLIQRGAGICPKPPKQILKQPKLKFKANPEGPYSTTLATTSPLLPTTSPPTTTPHEKDFKIISDRFEKMCDNLKEELESKCEYIKENFESHREFIYEKFLIYLGNV